MDVADIRRICLGFNKELFAIIRCAIFSVFNKLGGLIA